MESFMTELVSGSCEIFFLMGDAEVCWDLGRGYWICSVTDF